MKLSESLRRNIFDSFVGGIINRFKLSSRRNVLFFEDMLAEYIKKCECSGHEKEIEKIGEYWGAITTDAFLPHALRLLPVSVIANTVGVAVWKNIGLMDYMAVSQKGNIATLETRNEYLSRVIGKNSMNTGKYGAVLSIISGKKVELMRAEQNTKRCIYVFKTKNELRENVVSKGEKRYIELNRKFIGKGYCLKDAVRGRLFQIKGNKLSFRGYSIIPLENTLFSIIGTMGPMTECFAGISEAFFKKTLKIRTLYESLKFLKKLMQIMGWGTFNIIVRNEGEIEIEVENMPYGLQKEPDNWDVMVFIILGYLKAVNSGFRLKEKYFGKTVRMLFVLNMRRGAREAPAASGGVYPD